MEFWQEKVTTGEVVGRDPRKMTQDELRAIGHEPVSLIKAIRLRCLDCCGGSSQEVRYCTARKCPSWPFRTGKNPWRKPRTVTEDQKHALAKGIAKARENRRLPVREEP